MGQIKNEKFIPKWHFFLLANKKYKTKICYSRKFQLPKSIQTPWNVKCYTFALANPCWSNVKWSPKIKDAKLIQDLNSRTSSEKYSIRFEYSLEAEILVSNICWNNIFVGVKKKCFFGMNFSFNYKKCQQALNLVLVLQRALVINSFQNWLYYYKIILPNIAVHEMLNLNKLFIFILHSCRALFTVKNDHFLVNAALFVQIGFRKQTLWRNSQTWSIWKIIVRQISFFSVLLREFKLFNSETNLVPLWQVNINQVQGLCESQILEFSQIQSFVNSQNPQVGTRFLNEAPNYQKREWAELLFKLSASLLTCTEMRPTCMFSYNIITSL